MLCVFMFPNTYLWTTNQLKKKIQAKQLEILACNTYPKSIIFDGVVNVHVPLKIIYDQQIIEEKNAGTTIGSSSMEYLAKRI